MRYFDAFSGIGGFTLGIQQAYESNDEHAHISEEPEQEECTQRRVGSTDKHRVQLHTRDRAAPLCVGYSEIDKYATQIYEKQFPEHKNYGNITTINEKELPDFDLLVGGFPCQAFSIAGKRGGFEDTRGTLFFDLARILREKQPRLFVFENVKGLLSHDKGHTFHTIIRTLDELGYDLQWQVLNSKNHGVPQNRERVFIVGHFRGTPRPEVFPLGASDEEPTGKADKQRCANTLTGRSAGGANRRGNYIALTERRTEEAKKIRRETKDRDFSPRRGKYLAPREDGKGNCVTAGQSKEHFLTNGSKIRRLMPVECERLQGFPDNWTDGISDTQRYKTLGNAVTVNVIRDIFTRI